MHRHRSTLFEEPIFDVDRICYNSCYYKYLSRISKVCLDFLDFLKRRLKKIAKNWSVPTRSSCDMSSICWPAEPAEPAEPEAVPRRFSPSSDSTRTEHASSREPREPGVRIILDLLWDLEVPRETLVIFLWIAMDCHGLPWIAMDC